MQLTMKALETGYIVRKAYVANKTDQEYISECNKLIAIEVGKFYQTMLSAVKGDDDFVVQV